MAVLYPDYKTIDQLTENIKRLREPDKHQFERLSKEEKTQFNWLHSANIKVLVMQEYEYNGKVGYNAWDVTMNYRYPILQTYRDMRDFRNMVKQLASFSFFKIEGVTYFIDSVFTGSLDEKLAYAYARGVFKLTSFMDLD